MKKLLVLFLMLVLFACANEENSGCPTQDASICVSDVPAQDGFSKDTGVIDTGNEQTLCSTGEALSLEDAVPVSNAIVDVDFGTVKMTAGGESGPAEKTQFDVILKSAGGAKVTTDNSGEFVVQITQDDLKKLPEYFEIMFTISPPENSGLSVKSNKNIISFYKYNITQFRFRLSFSNGYFIVELVNQPNKLIVTRSDSGAKKALDAFITATTKAETTEKSEPVPGAEITVEQVPIKSPPKKDKKKSMIFTETGKSEEVVVHCYEVVSDETINTFADNEGYFSIRIKDTQSRYVVLSVIPPQDSNYRVDIPSMLIKLP